MRLQSIDVQLGPVSEQLVKLNRNIRALLQRAVEAIEVEPLRLLGEVGVGLVRETDVGEDLEVVRPRRVGEVARALRVRLVELGQEEGT